MSFPAVFLLLAVSLAALSESGIYSAQCPKGKDCALKRLDQTPVDQKSWDAYCEYGNTLLEKGWDQLKCKSNPASADRDAATALGYLEGNLLAQRIRSHRKNIHTFMLKRYFKADAWPAEVVKYVEENYKRTVQGALDRSASDERWYGVQLLLWQVDGLVAGANAPEEYKDDQMSMVDYWLYLASGEALDLYQFIKPEARFNWEAATKSEADLWHLISNRCSGLVRLAPDGRDAYISQVAWFTYGSMTRVLKAFEFGWAGTHGQRARRVSFSSYPGFIQSFDDFYVSSEGIAAFETTNSIYDASLYDQCRPSQLFTLVRAPLAMRMAGSGAQWAEIFTKDNSGTYNNQWQVLDYKRLPSTGAATPAGLLTVLEQTPGHMQIVDYTETLLRQGYVPSFNQYMLATMAGVSGQSDYAKKDPTHSFTGAPRYKVFYDRIVTQKKCQSYAEFRQLMRYNDRANPAQSQSPGFGIAARYDQNEKKPIGFGGLDAKTTNLSLMMGPQGPRFDAVAGPTRGENDQYPAWQYDDAKYPPGTDLFVPHEGLPEHRDWVFDWVEGFGFA